MIALILTLPHERQISPDSVQYPLEGYKNVNFPCTTAAFNLSPEPVGFVMSCQLSRKLGPGTRLGVMRFLFPGSGPGQAWSALLHSGFLQTIPHGIALAFGSYF
jgi:hypothetical protein